MAVPQFHKMMLPFLQRCADGNEHTTGEMIDYLAKHLALSPTDLSEPLPSGIQTLLGQWTHPNSAGLDDSEMTRPVIATRYQIGQPLPCLASSGHRYAQQHDAALRRQRCCSREFAKVGVEGQKNTLLARCPRQHGRIGHAGSRDPHPSDVVPE
jgi:restriction endonuclease Mrr